MSLIWCDFLFPSLQNKEPTVTVINFIFLTALFQAVTGTRPLLCFCVTERNREPTFLGLRRPVLALIIKIFQNKTKKLKKMNNGKFHSYIRNLKK